MQPLAPDHVRPVPTEASMATFLELAVVSRGTAVGAAWARFLPTWARATIGRITMAGVVTDYASPSIGLPQGIVAGSDRRPPVTNQGNDSRM